jgi:hypothetical protein
VAAPCSRKAASASFKSRKSSASPPLSGCVLSKSFLYTAVASVCGVRGVKLCPARRLYFPDSRRRTATKAAYAACRAPFGMALGGRRVWPPRGHTQQESQTLAKMNTDPADMACEGGSRPAAQEATQGWKQDSGGDAQRFLWMAPPCARCVAEVKTRCGRSCAEVSLDRAPLRAVRRRG